MVVVNFLNSIGVILSLFLCIAWIIVVRYFKIKIKNNISLKNIYEKEYLNSKVLLNINLGLFILFYINSVGNILIILVGIVGMYFLLVYSFIILYKSGKKDKKELY